MSYKSINLYKAEIFLIEHLKEVSLEGNKHKIQADYSLSEFISKFEQAMKE